MKTGPLIRFFYKISSQKYKLDLEIRYQPLKQNGQGMQEPEYKHVHDLIKKTNFLIP